MAGKLSPIQPGMRQSLLCLAASRNVRAFLDPKKPQSPIAALQIIASLWRTINT
jgi:hypothetical protein